MGGPVLHVSLKAGAFLFVSTVCLEPHSNFNPERVPVVARWATTSSRGNGSGCRLHRSSRYGRPGLSLKAAQRRIARRDRFQHTFHVIPANLHRKSVQRPGMPVDMTPTRLRNSSVPNSIAEQRFVQLLDPL